MVIGRRTASGEASFPDLIGRKAEDMGHKSISLLAIFWAALLHHSVLANALAQEPYYKGKTVRFLINFSAGGPTDVFGRLIARYFSKHVAGNPAVVVQNMSGAGGIIGANYVYEIAKPDGLTVGVFSGMYLPQILGGAGVRYDLNKRPIIAGAAETSIVYIRADTEVKTPADLLKPAKPVVLGGFTGKTTRISRSGSPSINWEFPTNMSPATPVSPNFVSRFSAARSMSLPRASPAITPAVRSWSKTASFCRSIKKACSTRRRHGRRRPLRPTIVQGILSTSQRQRSQRAAGRSLQNLRWLAHNAALHHHAAKNPRRVIAVGAQGFSRHLCRSGI